MKKPQDATLRNARASRNSDDALAARIANHDQRLKRVEFILKSIEKQLKAK